MKFSLTGNDWKLIYIKNEDYLKDGSPTELCVLKEKYPEIDAVVPGNLEIDLVRNGIIEDPFYGNNFFDRSCEYLHMFYTKEFVFAGEPENPVLVFEGLDTCADIYLNGSLVGSTENMLIPHEIEIAGAIKRGDNTLTVHIKPAVIEARKYPLALNENALKYNYESLYIRKAPHTYGWDIFPRIVSGGIFRPVYLEERKADRITELCGYTASLDARGAKLYFAYNTEISCDDITRYSVKLEGVCGESRFVQTSKLYHTGGRISFTLKEPMLWWPKNAGEPNLYNITFTLFKDGDVADVHTTRLGIRTVELDRTSTTNEKGDGQFRFIVNGKPVFCMGTNWVPVDSLHSRDAERLPHILPMLTDIGCNIIRIWGGGIYEDEQLYNYCDEQGIMIWQDFMMGCAVYPQDEEFQRKIREEASVIVKKLRMHPSIILWAGDNENDFVYYYQWNGAKKRDPNTNLLTRKVLPEVLRMHDYARPYLPSSPYVDEEAYKNGGNISEDHLWGPRDYFKGDYYKNTVCHFASETGYHGCPSPASLEKYIPKEYLFTAENGSNWKGIDNEMWLAHASSPETETGPYLYRIRLMADQATTLFGSTVPCNLVDFAKASQISQAEAKKYFIERFRVSKWRRTGIIWWNLIDGCPQISDAVVDYYYCKKLAYHYIKRSQEPLALIFDEPKNEVLTLYAVNDLTRNAEIAYKVTDLTSGKIVVDAQGLAQADASSPLCNIKIEKNEKHFYLIEWTVDGLSYSNHYMTNIKDIDYVEYMGYIKNCGYDQFEGF